jgi:hypothetical protein
MNILSISVLLLLGLQCVFSIPRVKETMLSLAQCDVNKKWNSFKLKHTRSFTNKSEETRR